MPAIAVKRALFGGYKMGDMNPEDPGKQGEKMRQKAMAMAMKRKEEYLGARVPKALKDRVIAKADEMNIPVSLLIRRVLEEAFSDGTERQSGWTFLKSAVSENKANEIDKLADIIGWKAMEVNQDRSCERCREPLPKGSEAELGFSASDSGYVIVCHTCKTQLTNT
jgi:hypothetical protein